MNRIYQGRATSIAFLDPSGEVESEIDSFQSTDACPIWKHHQVFQSAVNYYLVALGALANGETYRGSRLIADLEVRLSESWEQFPRNRGAKGLRKSIAPWLNLDDNASLRDAFAVILDGFEGPHGSAGLALGLLLAKCSGDSAIQQGGRGYFPRLCWAKYTGSFDHTASARESESGKAELAAVLHGDSDQDALVAIAARMELDWTVKVQPGKFYVGDDAKTRVTEALEHLRKMVAAPPPRLAEWLSANPDTEEQILKLKGEVASLADDLTVPRNRKAAQDLTFASIAFKHFPCEVTRQFLRLGVKAPAKSVSKPKQSDFMDFGRLGDDPIKLARGSRGYVFPAFTALPAWNPSCPGEPVWKEFDIAAFKEALKALNQFNMKTLEREKNRLFLESCRAWMLGESTQCPKRPDSDGEDLERLPLLAGDPRYELAKSLEQDLTGRLMLDRQEPFTLSRASLRGLRDISEKWNTLLKNDPEATDEELREVVKRFQADPGNQREIGSLSLLLALCETPYRPLWIKSEDDSEPQGKQNGRPSDILSAMVSLHQLERDLQRAKEPIRLTPAEPVYSRRLFMFSDLAGRSTVKFVGANSIDVSIAVDEAGVFREKRVRIRFSAPRLERDELTGGAESRWLQPMTAALGFSNVPATGGFTSAVALMPDWSPDGKVRHLLNFPVDLDSTWLQTSLGKADRWREQFNGTRENFLHLHWPTSWKLNARVLSWWKNAEIIKSGFTVLSNDLGQRNAGAWSLLRVTCTRPTTTRPVRSIGSDGEREWFAEIVSTGTYRLPGEEASVQERGKFKRERYGSRGRLATEAESMESISIAQAIGAGNPLSWFDGARSLAEQNDRLIRIANRRLSRLGTYHRWSCFDPDKTELVARRENILKTLAAELAAFEDPVVKSWIHLIESANFAEFRAAAGHEFERLREELLASLLQIVNRTVPLRHRRWVWMPRGGDSVYGELTMVDEVAAVSKIRGQRGLSMPRLEQLESVRRLFLRFNRSLDREAGVPAKFGRDDRGRDSGEPCPDILEKLERMKEQRINQTAHQILAQALGVTFRAHEISEDERARRDLHGEYTRIPGRSPVDFVVIEDLSRYRSSQGRAPSENSRLMKWAHRAIRDKLKMLVEEPFGIPLVEVVPAYSSRFHAVTGEAGSRVIETDRLAPFRRSALEKLALRTERKDAIRARAARELLLQFDALETLNRATQARREKVPKTLFLPQPGGPLFLSSDAGSVTQADTNAASNLGLRALAAPNCFEVLQRVRATREKGVFRPRRDNVREKAVYSTSDAIELVDEASRKLAGSANPNFFYLPKNRGRAIKFDLGALKGHPVVSGVALWSHANESVYDRCVQLNLERLERWANAEDEIPM